MAPLFTGLKLGGFGKNPDVAVGDLFYEFKVWGAGGSGTITPGSKGGGLFGSLASRLGSA